MIIPLESLSKADRLKVTKDLVRLFMLGYEVSPQRAMLPFFYGLAFLSLLWGCTAWKSLLQYL